MHRDHEARREHLAAAGHGTFHAAYGTLAQWVDAVIGALGVPWSRTVLGGFSMGAIGTIGLQ